jgi:3-oxoacyl-[acyl-carrier protein] reductase
MLKDKVAVITGAGQGIGRAFALRFAEEGAKLLLADIKLEGVQKVAEEVRAKGSQAFAVRTDISDSNSTKEMADKAMEHFGRVDILLNNASIWAGSISSHGIHGKKKNGTGYLT